MNVEASAAPTADTPAPTLAPGAESPTHEQMATAGGDGISTDQFRGLVLDGLARGTINQARANKELTDAGYAALTEQEAANPNALPNVDGAPSTKAPAQPDAEKSGTPPPGFEPAKAHEFKLPDLSALNEAVEGKALTSAETMQLQASVGGWMEEAGLPASIGAAIANTAAAHVKQMPHYEKMEDGARSAYRIGQTAIVERHFGRDALKNVDLARGLVQQIEAKRPGIVAFLERTGLGDNASVIMQLALQAKRAAAKG